MEREEFKKRIKGLLAWILVGVLLLQYSQSELVSVYAEGTDTTVNVPVRYYDEYVEGIPDLCIPIKAPGEAGTGEAYFASEGYTTEVALEADATSMLNSKLVFPTVEKDGYIFSDWSIGISGGYYVEADMPEYSYWDWSSSGYTADMLAEQEIPFYAKWRGENTITIEYRISEDFSDVGSIKATDASVTYYESQTAEPVNVVTPEVTLLRDNWFFSGWYCEELADMPSTTFEVLYPECEVLEDGTLIGGQNKTYTMNAEFVQAMEMTVAYDANNGADIITDVVIQESLEQEEVTVTLAAAPSNGIYEFAGWYCDATDEIYAAEAEVTLSIYKKYVTFVAQWECDIPITYDTAGGTITSTNHDTSVSVSIDATSANAVVLPTVEKDGSFFLDWELEISGGGTYGTGTQDISWDSYTPASSVTEMVFTAEWQEAIASAITYEFSGGMMNGYVDSYVELVAQETINSVDFEVPVTTYKPTKVGYMFTDWEWQASETGSGSYEGGKISGNYGDNYTLVAKFRPENTISITATMADGFEDAGTIDPGMAKTYGESIDNDGNGNALISLPGAKEIADGYFFIGWKCFDANGKEVIFDGYTEMTDYDGSVIKCYPAGTSLSIAYPTDDNNAGGNNASYILEAQFKKAVGVNVVFDLNGGSGDIALNDTVYQEKFGDTTVAVTMPKAPVRAGFEFLGWKYNGANYTEVINVDVTLGEITLIADWKKVIEAGKILLKAGQEYKLSEGNWTVDGDTTVYVGGSNFYVSEEAEYTFTKK